jgi:hypothetical protein
MLLWWLLVTSYWVLVTSIDSVRSTVPSSRPRSHINFIHCINFQKNRNIGLHSDVYSLRDSFVVKRLWRRIWQLNSFEHVLSRVRVWCDCCSRPSKLMVWSILKRTSTDGDYIGREVENADLGFTLRKRDPHTN